MNNCLIKQKIGKTIESTDAIGNAIDVDKLSALLCTSDNQRFLATLILSSMLQRRDSILSKIEFVS